MTIERPTVPPGVINEDRLLYFQRIDAVLETVSFMTTQNRDGASER